MMVQSKSGESFCTFQVSGRQSIESRVGSALVTGKEELVYEEDTLLTVL